MGSWPEARGCLPAAGGGCPAPAPGRHLVGEESRTSSTSDRSSGRKRWGRRPHQDSVDCSGEKSRGLAREGSKLEGVAWGSGHMNVQAPPPDAALPHTAHGGSATVEMSVSLGSCSRQPSCRSSKGHRGPLGFAGTHTTLPSQQCLWGARPRLKHRLSRDLRQHFWGSSPTGLSYRVRAFLSLDTSHSGALTPCCHRSPTQRFYSAFLSYLDGTRSV